MSCICMMGNFLLSGLFGISVCWCCTCIIIGGKEGGGGIQTSADPNLMQQLKLDRNSQALCMSPTVISV